MDAVENVVIPSELTAREDLEVDTPARILLGWTGRLAMVLSIILSVYALYWVVGIVQPLVYRASFLLLVLVLGFLYYPGRPESKSRVTALDWLFALLSVAACLWPIVDFQDFIYRAADPTTVDVALGTICVVLVLEATRRTAGWVLPVTAAAFLAYSYYGPLLDLVGLGIIAHRGYDLSRTIGTTYMTLEGIFGVPLDVAATYIVLFAIYGAMLEASGAGKFFLEWSLAAVGNSGGGAGPGRAVTIAGGLLGTVSGSGVATTVTLGSVGWPLLKRSGYDADTAGAMLSAAGIGAIISPPTLGAAAFIIAEFLHISYLKVLVMSSIPCLLYFISIFVMIEADARRSGTRSVPVTLPPLWHLTKRYGYHFLTLLAIPVLLVFGMSTFRAVLYSMLVALALSWVDKENRVGWRKLMHALYSGGRATLPVAATTATAGIIVGTVTLTGLGLKMSGLIVDMAGGYLFLTVLYSAIAIWILGLAVPVTASYIIAAVMVAPAMTKVGVPALAAHMFIFYYAVLSEVSPPTALAPVAAAALCGGRPVRTMMLTWKYTLPAFVFPFAFTLSKQGMGLLLQAPATDVLMSTLTAVIGILALGVGLGGWLRAAANATERVIATAAGLLLFYAGAVSDVAGLVLFAIAIALHLTRTKPQVATA